SEGLIAIGLLAHETKHREEIIGPQIARRARHFPFLRLAMLERGGLLIKELEGRREADAIFRGKVLLGQFLAVEILDLARTDDVELQDNEVAFDIVADVVASEIDEVRFLAVRAASKLPHHDKALAGLLRLVEILGQFEKALQKPRLLVEAIIGQD